MNREQLSLLLNNTFFKNILQRYFTYLTLKVLRIFAKKTNGK